MSTIKPVTITQDYRSSIEDLEFLLRAGCSAPKPEKLTEVIAKAKKIQANHGQVYVYWLPNGDFELTNYDKALMKKSTPSVTNVKPKLKGKHEVSLNQDTVSV